jgi:hypothetical protein
MCTRRVISLWLYKENNKLRDWKNVFTLHISPSSTHLWLRCSNIVNPSKKNAVGWAANTKIGKAKDLSEPLGNLDDGWRRFGSKCYLHLQRRNTLKLKTGAKMFLLNVGNRLQDYMVSQSRRLVLTITALKKSQLTGLVLKCYSKICSEIRLCVPMLVLTFLHIWFQ